jgi:hypothetical protein
MLEASENQLCNHRKQSNFLSQLAAKTVPKGLHCLSMRNTLPLAECDFPATPELEDNDPLASDSTSYKSCQVARGWCQCVSEAGRPI